MTKKDKSENWSIENASTYHTELRRPQSCTATYPTVSWSLKFITNLKILVQLAFLLHVSVMWKSALKLKSLGTDYRTATRRRGGCGFGHRNLHTQWCGSGPCNGLATRFRHPLNCNTLWRQELVSDTHAPLAESTAPRRYAGFSWPFVLHIVACGHGGTQNTGLLRTLRLPTPTLGSSAADHRQSIQNRTFSSYHAHDCPLPLLLTNLTSPNILKLTATVSPQKGYFEKFCKTHSIL